MVLFCLIFSAVLILRKSIVFAQDNKTGEKVVISEVLECAGTNQRGYAPITRKPYRGRRPADYDHLTVRRLIRYLT